MIDSTSPAQTTPPCIVLPGKGRLASLVQDYLAAQGIHLARPDGRCYSGYLTEYPAIEALFQRATDVPSLIHQGYATIGITGYDILVEYQAEMRMRSEPLSSLVILQSDMGFGSCSVQMSVPAHWDTAHTIADIRTFARLYPAQQEHPLRIATHYTGITRQFLQQHDIAPYTLVTSLHGSYEAAPHIGLSDVIVDLVVSGDTVTSNGLKFLEDGVLLRSQACLLANRELLLSQEKSIESLLTRLGMCPVPTAV